MMTMCLWLECSAEMGYLSLHATCRRSIYQLCSSTGKTFHEGLWAPHPTHPPTFLNPFLTLSGSTMNPQVLPCTILRATLLNMESDLDAPALLPAPAMSPFCVSTLCCCPHVSRGCRASCPGLHGLPHQVGQLVACLVLTGIKPVLPALCGECLLTHYDCSKCCCFELFAG